MAGMICAAAAASDKLRAAGRVMRKPLHRILLRFERSNGSASTGTDWEIAADRVIADLEELNRSTEQDFLAVGGKLIEFRSAARQISSDMTALTELISGEQGRNAAQALSRVLERSNEMSARMEQSGQALTSVRDLSSRIRNAFLKLRETVSIFRTMCTLTRIETAKLGSAGAVFGNLANEVKPLSESIQQGGERVLAASAQLATSLQSALRSGAEVSAKDLKALQSLVANVVESLQSFEERQQRAREASIRQSAEYAAVCEAIEELAGSIQFHDITRQQIEHVAETLRQIRFEPHGNEDRGASPPPEIQSVLTLQVSQLSNAASVFAASMDRMERALDGIAARVREMAAASKTLMGVSDGEQNSFFLHMESCFTAILKAAGACTAAEGAVQATAAGLEQTIGRMRESIVEIRGIEIQIQRIAINATIGAAHIGASGNALSVIAARMHDLAFDSNGNTEEAARAIASMIDAVNLVSGGSTGAASGAVLDTDGLFEQMRQAVLELHSSSECCFSRTKQIATLASRLSDEIGSVRNGFSAGTLFDQATGRARSELERLGAEAVSVSSGDGALAPGQDMARFAKHYTMQRERDVHESVFAASAVLAPAAPSEAPPVERDGCDLGENVELF